MRQSGNLSHATRLPAGRLIIGIDEVGRGAWAGPVTAGAVMLPDGWALAGLRDSKLMTPLARSRANRAIRAAATAIGIGWVSAAEVDEHGLSWAVQQSGRRALEVALEMWSSPGAPQPAGVPPAQVLPFVVLDGSHNYLAGSEYESIAIVKADGLVPCVSAASVVAKVARDQYLELLDRSCPGYEFGRHKGYGTAVHQAALRQLGPSAHHRRSYALLRAITGDQS